MYIQQLYTGCLAEAAYYIESNGEAAIVDPLRETEPYLELASQRNAKIKYVFETHFHADFVSGHIDLAKKAGAEIIYGPNSNPDYKVHVAMDGEELQLGNIKIKVLHTPGHTPESTCYLVLDEQGKPHAVFTGDTLFVGDVGRPDLAVKSDITQEDLAGMLFDSLNTKLKTLPDDVIMYPAHGAGSACGKNIGKETFSTIGHQKQFNYAMGEMTKEQFVKVVTEGLSAPPKYFFMDASINKKGYESIDEVMKKNSRRIPANELKNILQNKEVVLLDTRAPESFEAGFIPGSVNIGLNGQYAPWVGALLDPNIPLVLVTDPKKEDEAVLRLARVGYENVLGILDGGIEAWTEDGGELDTVHSIDPEEFTAEHEKGRPVLDVRKPGEWSSGVVSGAELTDLTVLSDEMNKLTKGSPYLVHCAGGYRSMIAISLLKKHGFDNLTNIRGGMAKMKTAGVQTIIPEFV
jgi:hydroxyacylglutathione hydrolase